MAHGEWSFIVDSDDRLTPDAIERIEYYYGTIANDKTFAGVVVFRENEQGDAWLNWCSGTNQHRIIEQKYIDTTCLEYRYAHKIQGDRAEVVKIEVIKEYSFPKFGNEKFLIESCL